LGNGAAYCAARAVALQQPDMPITSILRGVDVTKLARRRSR
jgi:hypothetical protein